ncbi:MAG: histidine kinase [Candidatus Firestonebacteria bacterium]|nr:histidine kinase [Candidatus Firestonebacteria bacterium]
MPISILLEIAEKTSLILILIYVIIQLKWFQELFSPLSSLYIKLYYNFIFIVLGIIGALLSVKLDNIFITNIHLGIIIAGLLLGIESSLITGSIISGILIYMNFSYPALRLVIECCLIAIFIGFYNKIYDIKKIELKKILVIISATILIQIATFYIWQISNHESLLLPKYIFIVIINTAIGIYISLNILKNALEDYENLEALHAHETLKIANKTLPYLRTGLNPETAQMTVKLIMNITDVEAVAITDKDRVLAFEGLGSDHHTSGAPILTRSTRYVLKKGKPYIINNKKDIGCPIADCPLVSAVVAPLRCKNEIVGTLKLYQSKKREINPSKVSLSIGLANLLSVQMELAEVGKLEQLTVQAELRALQAQINPHFLFNTLNTIASFYRTQPELARQLLIKFADFFRKNLQQHSEFITLKEELDYIDDYLTFEKARFGERLVIDKDIDIDTLTTTVPVLTLQPIIENAMQHGISKKLEGGCIEIITRMQRNFTKIIIKDNGVGIPPQELKKVLNPGYGKGLGVGLSNINERLKIIYGKEYQVKIFSVLDKGTEVHLHIPFSSINYQLKSKAVS